MIDNVRDGFQSHELCSITLQFHWKRGLRSGCWNYFHHIRPVFTASPSQDGGSETEDSRIPPVDPFEEDHDRICLLNGNLGMHHSVIQQATRAKNLRLKPPSVFS